ncbi:MAG: glycosyltransferase [Owenweeksia sp.]|nr:glycosyltransferase [Owenweeksia sp.]MBF99672.1 glycosyltransferase [Owenweeksia sp.]HBF19416.1 glycosyltransferase [Cryomorphaceae bacterium]|tara:strand:+ start:4721 stop:5680 length:960 start_codon:yes stop_codon:yes gene_type:complete
MDISVVIPLYNEDESLKELYDWIVRVMEANRFSFEVVFVDDGSTDGSWNVITNLAKDDDRVKAIHFRRNHGKSAGLNVGFEAAEGDVVITMDADLQDSPDEIPELYSMIMKDGFDLVSGWKKKRHDPLSKTIPTKFYNWATRKISKIKLHDFNCGLKAYKNEVVKNVDVHGEMHRYIPFLAKNAGFVKIGEKVVHHQARKYGHTKFGLNRFINGPLDLLTLAFISKFSKRPMHFFGLYGTFMFIIGFLAAAYLGVDKLYSMSIGEKARLVTDNPWFYIALTTMILGTQLFLAGFLAEIVVRSSTRKTIYTVDQRLNFNH